jgi:hypothetical protein
VIPLRELASFAIFIFVSSKTRLVCLFFASFLFHVDYSLRLKLGVPFEFYTVIKEMVSSVDFNGKMCFIY